MQQHIHQKRAALVAIAGAAAVVAIAGLAIGALAIRKLLVGRAVFKSVHIVDLTVDRLRVSELIVEDPD
jgi:uncharacterized membrane protein